VEVQRGQAVNNQQLVGGFVERLELTLERTLKRVKPWPKGKQNSQQAEKNEEQT